MRTRGIHPRQKSHTTPVHNTGGMQITSQRKCKGSSICNLSSVTFKDTALSVSTSGEKLGLQEVKNFLNAQISEPSLQK